MQLNARIALVTGAGSGIGQAIAVTLAEQGAKVIVTDMSAELAAQTAKLIQDQHLVLISCFLCEFSIFQIFHLYREHQYQSRDRHDQLDVRLDQLCLDDL
jgi:NAD(P)-dependent dehydrogenase (short-subunit alcohol dehydrogenase family)